MADIAALTTSLFNHLPQPLRAPLVDAARLVLAVLAPEPPSVPAPIASILHEVAPDGLTVTFASAWGGATSALWAFGDGATGTGITASHTYAAPGSYPVTLVVSNAEGVMSAASYLLLLSPPSSGGGTPYENAVGATNPVKWYKLNDASATIVNSGSSGAADNGTASDMNFQQAGLIGAEDAVGGAYTTLPDGARFLIPPYTATTCTVAVLCQVVDEVALTERLIFGNGANSGFTATIQTGGALRFQVSGTMGRRETVLPVFAADTWTWVFVTRDNTTGAVTLKYSTDGTLQTPAVTGSSTPTGTIDLPQGTRISAGLGTVSGLVDEFLYWDTVLTDEQMQAIVTASGMGG